MDADLGELGRRRRRGGGGTAFSPLALFASGEQGVWYDPSDLTPEKTSWRQNLLTYSEQFDNVIWGKTGSTVTANATTAPDGTTTADKLIEDVSAGQHRVLQAITSSAGVAHAYSIYVKADTRSRISIFDNSSASDTECIFDLSNGTVVRQGAAATAIISSVGSGWYRCTTVSIPSVTTFSATARLVSTGTTSSYTGDGTSGLFIWGAQVERASTPSAYQRITDFNTEFLAAFPTTALFQDSAGTTPVTALGQSVGRILDKSGKGNHAIQATSASRPTIQARSNLLTYSEQFDNAAWTKTNSSVTANAGVAPDGTTTADLVTASASTTGRVTQAVTFTGNGTKCVSFFVKQGSATVNRAVLRDNTVPTNRRDFLITWTAGVPATSSTAGTGTIYPPESLDNGWWRILFAADSVVAANVNQVILYPDDALGTGTAYFWGAQAENATTPSAYQRVVTATDYADIGLPRNLLFDGVDDSLATTGNVDFSATDKVSLFSGLTKASDVAIGMVVELSATVVSNNGTFYIVTPSIGGGANYQFASKGTTATSANTAGAAPDTAVITGLGDIGAPSSTIRRNAVATSVTTTQGTGTYLSYPLYIGRRNNTNLPFNGRIFQLIIRGAATDSVTVINAEQYVAQRTGVTL